MITVTGTYQSANGTPSSGQVSFTPQYVATYDVVPAVVTQNTIKARLDDRGSFTATFLASDDPDWGSLDGNGDPLPVPYLIREEVDGHRHLWIGHINGAGPVDITDIVPLDEPPSVYIPVTGPAGPSGPTGPMGPSGPTGPAGPGGTPVSGLVSDVVEVDYLGIAAGSAQLNSASPVFSAGDVGKIIVVRDAGAAMAPLITTIASYVNDTRVLLSTTAGTTRDGTTGFFGTDNSAALLAAAPAAGEALRLPSCSALTTALPALSSDTVWEGNGRASTIYYAGADNAIEGVDISRVTMKDFRLVGPARGLYIPGTDPVYPQSADGINITKTGGGASTAATFYVTINNLTIENFSRDGISIDTPIVSDISGNVVYKTGRHGVHLYGTGQSAGTSVNLDDNFAAGCYEAGFYIKQMAYCTLSACAADANGIGYWYNNTLGLTENSCGTEEPYDFFALGMTANDYARGYSRRIMNGKVTQNAPYMIGNIGVAQYVTDVSRMVINVFYEGSPGAGAVSSLKVDAGCVVTLNESHIVTPMDLAPGTTVSLRDSTWDGTQAQYDALGTYDPDITYYIVG